MTQRPYVLMGIVAKTNEFLTLCIYSRGNQDVNHKLWFHIHIINNVFMMRILLSCLLAVVSLCVLHAQPANDSCADPITIAIDEVVSFTTVDATTDGPSGPNHATSFGDPNDSIPADVWYFFVAAETGVLEWSNCSTADYDSRMAIYSTNDACDASEDNLLATNDDGATCDNNTGAVIFPVVAGSGYVLRMGGFANDTIPVTTGSGTVVLTVVDGPANDFCTAAIPVQLGEDQAFTTIDAITDGPAHDNNPCFQFGVNTATNDIWYTFTPPITGAVEWTTCGTATFDTRLAVYNPGSACPPASDDLFACNDDGGGCANFTSQLVFNVEAGETYLLRLGSHASESGTGSFDLVSTTPIDPPVNDDCGDAIAVPIVSFEIAETFDSITSGTTLGGTFINEGYQFSNCLNNQNGGEFSDVWYTFETLGNEELEIQFGVDTDGDNAAEIFFIDLFDSCMERVDTLAFPVNCTFTDADNLEVSTFFNGFPLGQNEVYYLRITTRLTSDAPGDFFFQLIGDIITDVEEQDFASELTLFPNPTTDEATVRFSLDEATQVEARVFDMLGRSVRNLDLGNLPGGNQQFSIETADLPAGVYSLQLSNGRGQQNLKFVKN